MLDHPKLLLILSACISFATNIVETTAARGNEGYEFAADVEDIVGEITKSFRCDGLQYGYYADQHQNCQVFHICSPVESHNGRSLQPLMYSFFCPNKTRFSQDSRTCIAEDLAFDCTRAHELYHLNNDLGMHTPRKRGRSEEKKEIKDESKSVSHGFSERANAFQQHRFTVKSKSASPKINVKSQTNIETPVKQTIVKDNKQNTLEQVSRAKSSKTAEIKNERESRSKTIQQNSRNKIQSTSSLSGKQDIGGREDEPFNDLKQNKKSPIQIQPITKSVPKKQIVKNTKTLKQTTENVRLTTINAKKTTSTKKVSPLTIKSNQRKTQLSSSADINKNIGRVSGQRRQEAISHTGKKVHNIGGSVIPPNARISLSDRKTGRSDIKTQPKKTSISIPSDRIRPPPALTVPSPPKHKPSPEFAFTAAVGNDHSDEDAVISEIDKVLLTPFLPIHEFEAPKSFVKQTRKNSRTKSKSQSIFNDEQDIKDFISKHKSTSTIKSKGKPISTISATSKTSDRKIVKTTTIPKKKVTKILQSDKMRFTQSRPSDRTSFSHSTVVGNQRPSKVIVNKTPMKKKTQSITDSKDSLVENKIISEKSTGAKIPDEDLVTEKIVEQEIPEEPIKIQPQASRGRGRGRGSARFQNSRISRGRGRTRVTETNSIRANNLGKGQSLDSIKIVENKQSNLKKSKTSSVQKAPIRIESSRTPTLNTKDITSEKIQTNNLKAGRIDNTIRANSRNTITSKTIEESLKPEVIRLSDAKAKLNKPPPREITRNRGSRRFSVDSLLFNRQQTVQASPVQPTFKASTSQRNRGPSRFRTGRKGKAISSISNNSLNGISQQSKNLVNELDAIINKEKSVTVTNSIRKRPLEQKSVQLPKTDIFSSNKKSLKTELKEQKITSVKEQEKNAGLLKEKESSKSPKFNARVRTVQNLRPQPAFTSSNSIGRLQGRKIPDSDDKNIILSGNEINTLDAQKGARNLEILSIRQRINSQRAQAQRTKTDTRNFNLKNSIKIEPKEVKTTPKKKIENVIINKEETKKEIVPEKKIISPKKNIRITKIKQPIKIESFNAGPIKAATPVKKQKTVRKVVKVLKKSNAQEETVSESLKGANVKVSAKSKTFNRGGKKFNLQEELEKKAKGTVAKVETNLPLTNQKQDIKITRTSSVSNKRKHSRVTSRRRKLASTQSKNENLSSVKTDAVASIANDKSTIQNDIFSNIEKKEDSRLNQKVSRGKKNFVSVSRRVVKPKDNFEINTTVGKPLPTPPQIATNVQELPQPSLPVISNRGSVSRSRGSITFKQILNRGKPSGNFEFSTQLGGKNLPSLDKSKRKILKNVSPVQNLSPLNNGKLLPGLSLKEIGQSVTSSISKTTGGQLFSTKLSRSQNTQFKSIVSASDGKRLTDLELEALRSLTQTNEPSVDGKPLRRKVIRKRKVVRKA